ncbi:16345_t:CDS:2, partial [Racocetra fulgida]
GQFHEWYQGIILRAVSLHKRSKEKTVQKDQIEINQRADVLLKVITAIKNLEEQLELENIGQLASDIYKLKWSLENFCSSRRCHINYTALTKLLNEYGCYYSEKKLSNQLVRGILQRHVIEMVIKHANKYLQINYENEKSLEIILDDKEYSLETIMTLTTIKLLKCMESFSQQRAGTDEVTQTAPTKLRQLVYVILGNRGFSETLNEGEHPFIIKLRNLVIESLNQYRTIKDPQKRDEIEHMATELIRHIISIFCFRKNVREPIVEYKWYKYSDEFDALCMEASLDEDEIDKIMVDVCTFPLIGTNLEHEEKCKVISQASVLTTDKIKF